jgi:hypothetical protein
MGYPAPQLDYGALSDTQVRVLAGNGLCIPQIGMLLMFGLFSLRFQPRSHGSPLRAPVDFDTYYHSWRPSRTLNGQIPAEQKAQDGVVQKLAIGCVGPLGLRSIGPLCSSPFFWQRVQISSQSWLLTYLCAGPGSEIHQPTPGARVKGPAKKMVSLDPAAPPGDRLGGSVKALQNSLLALTKQPKWCSTKGVSEGCMKGNLGTLRQSGG